MIINTEKQQPYRGKRSIEILERDSSMRPVKMRLNNFDKVCDYQFYSPSYVTIKEIHGFDQVKSIGFRSFYSLPNLQYHPYLVLPSNIEYVDSYAFQLTISLRKIEIGAQEIRNNVFHGCTGLESVWIRESCQSIIATKATESPFVNVTNANFTIYVEADSKPAGFSVFFNRKGTSGGQVATVVYGQKTNPLL